MTPTFIDMPFTPTHRFCSGGDVQVLGIGTNVNDPNNRAVFYRNAANELFCMRLTDFVATLPAPNKARRFTPLRDNFELLTMINTPLLTQGAHNMTGRVEKW